MLEWIKDHQGLVWTFSAASVVIFVAALFLVPAIVVRIRPDYFSHKKRPDRWAKYSPWIRVSLLIGKNVLGAILMIAGLAMLALPGPGLVTALMGLLLMNFPGKYRFERWLMSRRAIARPINAMRRRAGRQPLVVK